MDNLPDPIDNLLDLVPGINKTPKTRSELNNALEIARGAYEYRHREQAPSDLFEQLDASIRKTLMLITKLGRYPDTRDIAFEMHPIGTGIADAKTGREMIEKGRMLRISRRPWVNKDTPPHTSADHIIVGSNVENLLRAFRISAEKAKKKRGRGQPRRTDKLSVVLYAADFFRAYSAIQPSTDENNPFRLFAERFFEVATGTKSPSLEWQIRHLDNHDPRSMTINFEKRRETAKRGK